jgi:hypothetical protein
MTRAGLWTAPAKRSGAAALDRLPTVVETPTSCVPGPQNPKRRGASLPAALQNTGVFANGSVATTTPGIHSLLRAARLSSPKSSPQANLSATNV